MQLLFKDEVRVVEIILAYALLLMLLFLVFGFVITIAPSTLVRVFAQESVGRP